MDGIEVKVVAGRAPAPDPPKPLSDFNIQMIHSGLLKPDAPAILSMSREIRMWRGAPNPDLI